FDCVRMVLGPGDEGDLAVPHLNEVAYGKHRAMPIVNLQAEQPRGAQAATRDHDRHFLGVTLQLGIAESSGENDDSVDAPRYEFPHASFFVLFVPIAAHEQGRISTLAQAGLN